MKILLIDDDVFFQKFYLEKLSERGFEVTSALDGQEGLEQMRTLSPNVVLLDLIMPVKDGFEVLQEVSKDEKLKKIPIIVFSTLGQPSDRQKAQSLGAKEFINKGYYDFEKLITRITILAQSNPVLQY